MRVVVNPHHGAYTLTPVNKRIAAKLKEYTGEACLLFQTDWDYPWLAAALGWRMESHGCEHNGTDGTVTCPECGHDAGEFICRASDWLDKRCGDQINLKDASAFPELDMAYDACKPKRRRK